MSSRSLVAIALFSCILTLASLIAWVPTVKASNTWTVDDDKVQYPAADFTHIQDAINSASAGDTILVYPGAYNERYVPPAWAFPSLNDVWAPAVIVYKDGLTIKAVDPDPMNTVIQSRVSCWFNTRPIQVSTNYGVNPAGGIGASTLIIVANYTTIDGFRIIRAWDGTNAGGYNMAPVLIGGLKPGDSQYLGKAHDNTVKNCILGTQGYWFNTPPPSTYPAPNPYPVVLQGPVNSWTGLYIWHSSNNLIENNEVYDVRWRALQIYDGYSDAEINLGFHSKDNQIIGNEVYNAWGGLFAGAWAPTVLPDNSGTTVKDNYFHDLTDYAIGFGYTDSSGVLISGNSIENCPTGIVCKDSVSFTGMTIDSNWIKTITGQGIYLNNAEDSMISENHIDQCGAPAIRLENCADVQLICNTLTNSKYGMRFFTCTGIVASCNNIVGNTNGVDNNSLDPAYLVAARRNFWGDSSGPYHIALNPTGLGNSVSDNVLFDPWLLIEACHPVGGEWVPANTLQILVQIVGSAIVVSAIAASFVGFKRIKKKQN